MLYDNIMESAAFIKAAVSQTPEIGIILGSGLGGLVDIMENKEVIPYSQIPHFPVSHVEGHAGNLVFGSIGGKSVVCMQGRFHYYEGFHMQEVTYPVYVMKQLGVRYLIVTNACGGINKRAAPLAVAIAATAPWVGRAIRKSHKESPVILWRGFLAFGGDGRQ